MSDFDYVSYDPARRDQTLRLMDKVQGVVTTAEEFEWWFERNPGGERNLFLALHEGHVVGCNSLTPYRMTFDGRTELVGFPQKICVDEVCRGKGVFLKMQKRLEAVAIGRGMRFFLGFPNANAYPIWTGKWSCLDLPAKRLWLRVERPEALLRTRLPSTVARLAGLPYRALFRRGAPQPHRRDVSFSPIGRFGLDAREFDALWAELAPAMTSGCGMIARTAAWLDWRYLDAPSSRYRATVARRAGSLEGYVVTGLLDKDGLQLGYIADLLARPGHGVGAALLDRGLDELAARGADAMAALEPHSLAEKLLFASRGFVPTPRRFPVIGKSLDGDEARVQSFLQPDRLRFTLGDLDFF